MSQALSPPLIWIIDDSPTVRMILKTCFQRAAFRVRTFNNGVEALRWFGSLEGEAPALVYLDIELPYMDGYDVLRRLRARPEYGRTGTIMLSCRDGVLDRLKGRLVGATASMTKPFRTEEILATTRAVLGHMDVLPPLAQPSPVARMHR